SLVVPKETGHFIFCPFGRYIRPTGLAPPHTLFLLLIRSSSGHLFPMPSLDVESPALDLKEQPFFLSFSLFLSLFFSDPIFSITLYFLTLFHLTSSNRSA
ncbi:hypothetical protein TorRG33x02_014980, partial [Trema orientale]